jgi:hypothetical protein
MELYHKPPTLVQRAENSPLSTYAPLCGLCAHMRYSNNLKFYSIFYILNAK